MENLREIVNGSLLQSFNGKAVSLTGVASKMHPNGLSFEMRTLDDVTVKVILKRPSKNELQGFVEVHGIANGNSINCDEIIQFTEENNQAFDVASHNQLCTLLNTCKQLWQLN